MPSFLRFALTVIVVLVPASLLAQGSGFGPLQVATSQPDQPVGVFAADLDGDGDMDVLSASQADGTFAWYANQGDGTFGPGQVLSNQALGPQDVIAADLDGDGDMDVISGAGSSMDVFENLGGGSFGPAQTVTPPSIFSLPTLEVRAADVDGDGDLDLVSVDYPWVRWYENLGGIAFAPPQLIAAFLGLGPFAKAGLDLADLDGDGDLDVLAAIDQAYYWIENLGSATFGPAQLIMSGETDPESIAAGDLDGDGDADVVACSRFGTGVSWFENLGGGLFGPQHVLSIQLDHALEVVASDLDRDGDLDILTCSDSESRVSWFRNLGGGVFSGRIVITSMAAGASSVAAADLDGDGDLDVLSANRLGHDLTWNASLYAPSEPSNLLASIAFPVEGLGQAVTAPGDLGGDGKADVVWASPRWNGDRGRIRAWSPSTGQVLWTVDGTQPGDRLGARLETLGDVDGDGVADVVVAIPGAFGGNGGVGVVSGATGAAISGFIEPLAATGFGEVIAAGGDWNGDGVPDFAVGAPSFDFQGIVDAGRVRIYSGAPPASGTTALLLQTLIGTAVGETLGQALSFVADRDGDGKDELIVAHRPGGAAWGFSILSGGNAISLGTVTPLGAGPDLGSGFAADRDLNGDGVPEILVGDETAIGGDGRTWLYDGATLNLIRMRSGASGAGLGFSVAFVGDLNGDGAEDYVLGAPRFFSSEGQWAGRLLLIDGPTGNLLNDTLASQGLSPDVFIGSFSSRLGTAVVRLGDVDGDGFSDFAAGLGFASEGWIFSGLNPKALFSDCAAGTAGEDLVLIDGAAGGGQRRVSVPVNTPFTFSVIQPSAGAAPAPFVIAGYLAVPTTAQEFVLPAGLGSLCLPPVGLDPASFLLTDNLTPSTSQLVPSMPTPWTLTNTVGLPFPFAITFQGLIVVQPGDLRVTNAVILDVTP